MHNVIFGRERNVKNVNRDVRNMLEDMIILGNNYNFLKENPMLGMLIASYSRGLAKIWRNAPNIMFSSKITLSLLSV
jgi:hypothetical protein